MKKMMLVCMLILTGCGMNGEDKPLSTTTEVLACYGGQIFDYTITRYSDHTEFSYSDENLSHVGVVIQPVECMSDNDTDCRKEAYNTNCGMTN